MVRYILKIKALRWILEIKYIMGDVLKIKYGEIYVKDTDHKEDIKDKVHNGGILKINHS